VTVTTGNRTLAARARDLANSASAGSLERKAAGCLAVALGTTNTVTAARKVLSDITTADIRDRATQMLAELADEANAA